MDNVVVGGVGYKQTIAQRVEEELRRELSAAEQQIEQLMQGNDNGTASQTILGSLREENANLKKKISQVSPNT